MALGSGDGHAAGARTSASSTVSPRSPARPSPAISSTCIFPGHGSQQPALNDTTEADGRDEVFLSADTQDGAAGQSELLPQRADRRRDVGGAEGDPQDRRVRLGGVRLLPFGHDDARRAGRRRTRAIARSSRPTSAFPTARSRCRRPRPTTAATTAPCRSAPARYDDDASDPNEGGLVAFFAAQTSETTPEHDFDVPQAGRHDGADPLWRVHLHDLLGARQEPEP